MWRSLRFRLLLATILVVLIAVGVTAFVATRRTTGEFQRYMERRSPLDDRRLAFLLARAYDRSGSWDGVQVEVAQLAQISGQRVVVADGNRKVVADSDDKLIGKAVDDKWPPPSAALISAGMLVGALYLDPLSGTERADAVFLAAVNRSVLVGALIAGLAAVAVTLLLSSRIFRPIEHLTEAAERMEKGDLTVRVPVASEDEIGQLAHAFNSMAGSLAQQEQLRRNMVTDVAHELRTPLTNLRGYLEAARDDLVPADAALVDNLYEETMLLSRLVADLQELAQAEAGQLALQRQSVLLTGIVEQAVAILQPQAHAKGLKLEVDLSADLPPVDVDPERVGQVLRNLLNNAIAHTPEGGEISVTAEVAGAAIAGPEAASTEVTVSVHDTGTGIAPEHLPYVFDRFYRADKSRARQTGGAGLGLAIVRQLVIAHGGSISVESVTGEGTTFTFTLPVAQM